MRTPSRLLKGFLPAPPALCARTSRVLVGLGPQTALALAAAIASMALARAAEPAPPGDTRPAPPAAAPAAPRVVFPEGPRPFKIFDGKPKTIALLTSSHAGGGELFPRIKKMPGAENITCQSRGFGTDEDVRRTFPSALPPKPDERPDYCPQEKLAGANPVIFIVLSGALRARDFPPVPGSCTEQEAIQRGVEIMCAGVKRTEAQGVGWVLLSTMHYNPNPAWPHCSGWERCGDLVASYNQTEVGKRHPAVDIWTPLKPFYPESYSGDMYHSSAYGRQVVAHVWFSALCAWDGIEAPVWSWQMAEEARKRETDRVGIRDVRAQEIPWPQTPSGRALEVTWSAEERLKKFNTEFFRCEQYYAARGGRSGAGRFIPLPDAQVSAATPGWKLVWPLPASPKPGDSFRNGDHYFVKIHSEGQWNVSLPVKLGPGGDPAPWTRRP